MTISYAGSLTIGAAVPMAATAQASLAGSLTAAMPDLEARIAGLLQVSVAPPPSLPDLVANVTALLASLQSLLVVPIPDVSATVTALAELQATFAQLTAALSFSASLGTLLAQGGIHYYVFAGRAGDLDAELGSQLSSGLPGGGGADEQIAGAILLANDSGAISALRTVLRA